MPDAIRRCEAPRPPNVINIKCNAAREVGCRIRGEGSGNERGNYLRCGQVVGRREKVLLDCGLDVDRHDAAGVGAWSAGDEPSVGELPTFKVGRGGWRPISDPDEADTDIAGGSGGEPVSTSEDSYPEGEIDQNTPENCEEDPHGVRLASA